MMIWIWQTKWGFDLFCRTFERRKMGRRFPLRPTSDVAAHITDLTAEEVGQLMGGN